MKDVLKYILLILVLSITSKNASAQEEKLDIEESAEVFLEEYTDEFQETFFEALKQKGIQNYDRAINLLLQCKQMNVENATIDHELAKTHYLDKKYVSAQQYALASVVAEPKNYWYLDTLVSILESQSNDIDVVKNDIAFELPELQKNLALIYFKKTNYNKALTILGALQASDFKNDLTLKINDSLKKTPQKKTVNKSVGPIVEDNSPLTNYKNTIEALLKDSNFKALEERSQEALEAYPLQPLFHYAYGKALLGNGKPNEAIDVLESALDFLFDDTKMANDIYTALAEAHKTLGNLSRANEYLSKIKSGS